MRKLTNVEFIKKANEIHNNKYDYSLSNYINTRTKIEIICHLHGKFEQTPSNHIYNKSGCLKCDQENHKMNTIKFINKAKEIHKNKYDYSLTTYSDSYTHINIICPTHGEFQQNPYNHLNYHGCPLCIESKGENTIREILETNNIKYISQKSFNGCTYKRKLKFDFYLYDKNICIEYDGIQHFEPNDFFGGKKYFNETKKKDNIKNIFCSKNNIKLIRISYKDDIKSKLLQYL